MKKLETPQLEIQKARKKGPGSRGGKYWIDKNGKVHYGAPPKGTRTHASQSEITKRVNRLAKSQLSDIHTQDDLDKASERGWEIGVSGPEGEGQDGDDGTNYMHFGSGPLGKAAALEAAQDAAKKTPDMTYAVVKVDGNYVIASKKTSDLLKEQGAEDSKTSDQRASDREAKQKAKQGSAPDNLAMAAHVYDLVKRYYSAKERKKLPATSFAGPDKSFPIRSQQDVKNAARLVGHAKDPAAVKRKIIAIARRNGWELPAAWEKETEADKKGKGGK